MDFNLTEEQGMLQDSLRKFLANEYGFETRRKRAATPEGFSSEAWAKLAELGVLGIAIPESDGGLGGDAFDTLVVMEQMGPALVLEPYVSTVVLCGATIAIAGSAKQKEAWLPAIVGGEKKLAFAHAEANARYVLSHVETTARKEGEGWKLDGAKAVVRDAPSADALLVSARVSGAVADEAGLALFLVDPNDARCDNSR